MNQFLGLWPMAADKKGIKDFQIKLDTWPITEQIACVETGVLILVLLIPDLCQQSTLSYDTKLKLTYIKFLISGHGSNML